MKELGISWSIKYAPVYSYFLIVVLLYKMDKEHSQIVQIFRIAAQLKECWNNRENSINILTASPLFSRKPPVIMKKIDKGGALNAKVRMYGMRLCL